MAKKDTCIAIYSRKSKFTGKGESIGNQVELCKDYIRVHYGEEALQNVIVYEDEGFSGGNLNRPDYKNMMEAAKKHKIKTIVVYRLDRISRNISDFAGLIEELARLNVDFISIKERFDTGTPMGRAMMYITSVFSQLERETIAERIRDNMHELAKTGRWLGGNTPTGFTSEAVESVTIDGKAKKACKLKMIPEEAEIILTIFSLYIEHDSQTVTEAELFKLGYKSKQGNNFTRFSIKAILQNPVYMIADHDAYDYFVRINAEIFCDKGAFDGVHGIMVYNRTNQEKGKTTVYNPPEEWIVSVGLHEGLIPGKVWVKAQESLERNKDKGYRKSRINEALLTGLIFCKCGSRMYPKLSDRKTVDGKTIFSYLCSIKERSQRFACNTRNANGNTLDVAVVEQIKLLSENESKFMKMLEKTRKFYTGNRVEYEERLEALRKERAETERKVELLVDSLIDLQDSVAKNLVIKRLEQLNSECVTIDSRIKELEGLTAQHALNDIEFDMLVQMLSTFRCGIDEMTVEQKRAAIRTIVRKVIWDGTNAHLILFGASDDNIEYPDFSSLLLNNCSVDNENSNFNSNELEMIGSVKSLNEVLVDMEHNNSQKASWGEDSK